MKRVLAFALALILVISLIPVTTSAASPMPKVAMYDPSGTIDCRVGSTAEYTTWYVAYKDVVDDTGAVIGNRPVQTFTEPEDNYIRYYYDSTSYILYITLNNVHYTRTASSEHFIRVTNNSSYTKDFSVIVTLNGENTVSGTRTTFLFENTGNVTFTGDGSLDIQTYLTSNAVIWANGGGDLTIKDTNLTVYNSHGYIDATGGTVAGVMAKGSIIVDGATINVDGGNKSTALRTATATGSGLTSPAYGITIKHNANVVCTSGSMITLQTNGPIVIDNSSVRLHKSTGNHKPVFNKAPEIIGSYSSMKAGYGSLSKTYPGTYDVTTGETVAESQKITDFELVHKHVGTDCTKESLCACTKATVAATAESHTLEAMEAQDATCTEDGWEAYEYCVNCSYSTKVVIPATGTHALVQVDAKAATCGEIGWEAYEYCELCDYNTMVEIPATGAHNPIQVEAKAPTCGEPGWEAHEACSGCSTYSTKVEIPATGDHTYAYAEAKQATCAEYGWDAYRYCTKCNYSEKEVIPASGILSQMPFYMLNGEVPENLRTYMYTKPSFYTKTFVAGQTVPTVSWNGASTIPTLAAKLKAEFENRPAGTRYFKLDMVAKTMYALVEHNVYFDKAETEVTKWLEAFLAEYYRIGGKLDGIQVDSEYIYSSAWYIHLARYEKNPSALYNDPDIFWNIVNDPRYETEIRPRLVEVGFPFLAESSQTSLKSEIWGIDTQYSKAYNLWNVVNYYRMVEMIDRAVYQPLIKYYPNALVTDYQVRYINGWQKSVMNSATPYTSNRIGLGTTSNFNAYAARPQDSVYGGGSDAAYTTPAAYNGAAYEPNPFNMVLWETNIFKDMYDANPYNRVAAHMTFFNYNPNKKGTYSNTPYYTESFYHIALMDPEPFMGYIIESEVFSRGKNLDDPNVADFGYNLSVVEAILKELSRVAGASDRKHIPVSSTWNSSFILSGMYAGGRNIWRITPDTYTGVSLADFKIKDQAPTFYINGQTVIFPQGRIIEDGKIKQVGSCGYWVETPADVKPIIINDADRYSKYPSLQENFDGYTAGTAFTTDTALPKATWTVSGSATIQARNGSNALALTGTTTVNHLKLPANITAGDSYANNQVWEVKVTLPSSGKVNVLSTSSWDIGITITNGTVTYSEKYSKKTLSGVTLSAGGTYIIRRTLDLTGTNMKASFDIYDMTGKRIGGVSNVTVYRSTTGPIAQISFGSSITSGTAYIDDFKMYPIGVTTEFEAYDAESGFKLDSATATRNEDTAYRLSWMNASSEYKIAKVMNNGVVVEQILMAPGADGVATGVITGTNIKLSVTTENGTAPTYPDYDQGDFDWTSPAELIGLASGKSKGSFDPNNLTSIVLHDLVFEEGKDSSCTEDGWNDYEYCTKCDYTTYELLKAPGHDVVVQEAKPNSCTGSGLTEGRYCSVCGEVLLKQEVIPAHGHKEITEQGKAPTCTEPGLNTGTYCEVCGEVLAEQEVVPPTGHSYKRVATDPTCTQNGKAVYTCSTCGHSYEESIPATGHTYGKTVTSPTCTERGYTTYTCHCGDTYISDYVGAKGHTEVIDEAKAPTCTEPGLTEGKHCSACGEVFIAQNPIKANGHSLVAVDSKVATCTDIGWNAYEYCEICDYTTYEEIPALGHDLVYHEGKTPTYKESGWKAYETCNRCDYSTYKLILASMPKFRMYDPKYSSYLESYFNEANTVYVVYEDVLDEATGAVIGNKPVVATKIPDDHFIKYEFMNGVAIITMKNINYKRTAFSNEFIYILNNAGHSENFDVVIVLEGTNTVEGTNAHITLQATGNITITGSGSLTMTVPTSSNATIWSKNPGNLLIKDTTLTINQTNTNTGTCGNIVVEGAITIENSNVTITCGKATALITGTSYSSKLEDTSKGITITKGSNVTISGGSTIPVQTRGVITIDNSNVEMTKTGGNNNSVATSMPYFVGNFSTIQLKKNSGKTPAFGNASFDDYEEGMTLTTTERIIGIRVIHECVQPEDDGDCTTPIKCACGKELVAGFAHTPMDAVVENETDASYESVIYCSVCGKEVSRETISKVCTHPETEIQGQKNASCTETGYTGDKVCLKCGEVAEYGEEIPVEQHTPGAAADCENDQICTVCGEKLADKLGHTPGAAADCENDQVCTVCGEKLADKLGHTPGAAADCENDQICTVCEKILVEKLGHTPGTEADCENDQICTVCEKVLVEKLGHTPGAAADCENDQVCTVCEKVLVEKLGHTPGAAADCENDQICTVCEKVLVEKLGHTPGAAADCENDQICTVCEKVLVEKLGHNPGAAADCENDQICTVCGEKLADKLGHTPGAAADCENDQVCTVCEKVLLEKLGHTPGAEADCENDQICTVCEKVLVEKLGHTPGAAADCENDQICTVCGKVLVEKLGHKPGAAATCTTNQTCIVCNAQLASAKGHKYESETTDATCTENGKTVYTCSVCGDSYEEPIISEGHNYVKTETIAPTCEAMGYSIYTCDKCGDSYEAEFVNKLSTMAKNTTTGKLYPSLQEAINNAADGDTVVLTKNAKNAATLIVPANKKITVNLQGFYYAVNQVEQGTALAIGTGAEVTLKGSGAAKLEAMYASRIYFNSLVKNDGILTVEGVNLYGPNLTNEGAATIVNAGALTLNDGTVVNFKTVALSNTGTVTKTESVVLNAPENYHWTTAGVLEKHSYVTIPVGATANSVSYDLHQCACGASYKDNFGTKKLAAYVKIGDILYASLQEAVNNAEAGDTIVLLRNIKNATTLIVPSNKDITINLQSFYYAVSQPEQGTALVVEPGANVTLKGTGAAKLEAMYVSRIYFYSLIKNNGQLTVEGVNLYGPNLTNEGAATIINKGVLALNKGIQVVSCKTALINSGSVVNHSETVIAAPEGYHWSDEGVLETHSYTKVTSIPATCEKVSFDLHECVCGASYEDNYGTKKLSIVAKIGDKYYASMAEAIAAAKENDVIVLYKNVKNAETIIVTAGKKITIDLNGKYYAVNQITGKAALIVEEGAELILTGGRIEAQSISGNKDAFDCVVENNGKLKLENVVVYASNLYATDFAVINNGILTQGEGVALTVIKATALKDNVA